MITIYTNFWGAISSTQISNFLLMGTLWNFFLWEPFRGRLVSVFELIKKILWKHVFFTKCHYPYLLLLKIPQNEKSLQPTVQVTKERQSKEQWERLFFFALKWGKSMKNCQKHTKKYEFLRGIRSNHDWLLEPGAIHSCCSFLPSNESNLLTVALL